jgi:hypothetical protein
MMILNDFFSRPIGMKTLKALPPALEWCFALTFVIGKVASV